MINNYYNADGHGNDSGGAGHAEGTQAGTAVSYGSGTSGSGGGSYSQTPGGGGGTQTTRNVTYNATTAALYQAVAQVATSVIEGFFAQSREREANALQLKFAEMENRLQLLSADTQLALLNRAYTAQTENEKLALLNQVFALVATAQLQSTAYNANEAYVAALTPADQLTLLQEDKKQNNITMAVFALVGIAVLAAAFIEYKKLNQ